jgi:arylsulfatase A-like enzyme
MKRKQYAMALAVLDNAVGDVIDELDNNGLLDNSVIVFA